MSPVYLGVALVAAGTLVYEVALTRLFSIAHGYHFTFLAISMALLGFGASGTALALRGRRPAPPRPGALALLAAGAGAALLLGYLAANRIPFDPYRVAWEPAQVGLLAAYLLSLAAPFLLVGLALALPLMAWPARAGAVYGANLAGSAAGALLALAVLGSRPAEAAVPVAALLAAAGGLALSAGPRRRAARPTLAALAVLAVSASLLWRSPPWLDVRLSEYKPLSQLLNLPDARVAFRGSNALSRVDVVEAASIRSAPGLSLRYEGPLPRQTALVVDGEVVYTLTARRDPRLLASLPTALPFRLRPGARALVLTPGGGLDVLVALAEGARSVVAVEGNPLVGELVGARFRREAGGAYDDPRARLVLATPRRYLAGTDERFDVILYSLSESFRPVTAGSFSLTEDYAGTREGMRAALGHLAPGGLLAVHRWLQLPPTEELRAAATVAAALRDAGERPERSLVAIRSFSTMLILAKPGGFDDAEVRAVKGFAEARGFDLVYRPGIRPGEGNRFNVLRADVYAESFRGLLADPDGFTDRYEYDVAPARDDRPFFFHFFKWEQTPTVLALLGKTWQPFGGSGYLVVLSLLVVVTGLSAALVVLPALTVRRRLRRGLAEPGGWGRPVLYFAGLGLGFLLVEVALVQRSIVLLDHPAQAFSVVLFGVLLFSGLGSMLSARVPWRGALAALAALVAAYPVLLPRAFSAFLGSGLAVRVPVLLALLAPLGLLMGVPFPRGIRALGETGPSWLPLAWGVNGFASVVGAVLAAVAALSWGFTAVFGGAALAYLLALVAAGRGAWARPPREAVSPGALAAAARTGRR